MSNLPPLVSPCVGICEIDAKTELCMGCLRSLKEIALWRTADDATRRQIVARLGPRRRRIAAAAGAPPRIP